MEPKQSIHETEHALFKILNCENDFFELDPRIKRFDFSGEDEKLTDHRGI